MLYACQPAHWSRTFSAGLLYLYIHKRIFLSLHQWLILSKAHIPNIHIALLASSVANMEEGQPSHKVCEVSSSGPMKLQDPINIKDEEVR